LKRVFREQQSSRSDHGYRAMITAKAPPHLPGSFYKNSTKKEYFFYSPPPCTTAILLHTVETLDAVKDGS
jgi:hypothetical protein